MQKLHTSEKPLRCKRCNGEFPDRYTYKIHAKTHEGEKCYTCDLCPYASISARHLESHMLIHTDQKPFDCDQCDQSFRQKQLLRRHINLYHNPEYVPPAPQEKRHQCPTCSKSFRHKGNLMRHMATHDPDSALGEQAQALKLGRQKRLEIIDGKQVAIYEEQWEEYEIVSGCEPEDEDEEEADEDEEVELGDAKMVKSEEIILEDHEDQMELDGEMQMLEHHDENAEMVDVVEEADGDDDGEEEVCYVDIADRVHTEDGEEILIVRQFGSTEENKEYILPDEDEQKAMRQEDIADCFGFDVSITVRRAIGCNVLTSDFCWFSQDDE